MEGDKQTHDEKQSSEEESIRREDPETEKPTPENTGGWGWGFSVLSDLQKAAEDLSRNVMSRFRFDLLFFFYVFWKCLGDIGSECTVTNDSDLVYCV